MRNKEVSGLPGLGFPTSDPFSLAKSTRTPWQVWESRIRRFGTTTCPAFRLSIETIYIH